MHPVVFHVMIHGGSSLQVQGAIGETARPPRHSRANVIVDPRLSSAERHRDLDIAITSSLHPCPRTRPRATTNFDDLFFLTSPSTTSTTTSGNALSTRPGYRQSRGLDSHVAPDREQHDTEYIHSSYDLVPHTGIRGTRLAYRTCATRAASLYLEVRCTPYSLPASV